MSQAALAFGHDALLPRPPGGTGPGALLALAVHAGLIVALTTAVDWRTHTPEAVSAELWASVPQSAAPLPVTAAPPVPPPPPPPAPRAEPVRPDADIAIERAQQRKAEAEKKKAELRAEAERKRALAEKADADKRELQAREAKAEDERLARQREANLKRLMGQAGGASGNGGSGGTGTAAQSAAPTAAYLGRVAALIRGNSVFPGNVPGSAVTEVEVRTASGGTILSRKLVKSSGHQEWDEAVLRAIDKTATLPRDTDGRVPQMLTIAFRRE